MSPGLRPEGTRKNEVAKMALYGFGWKVTHRRKFDGKPYVAKMFETSASEAKERAAWMRDHGTLCRVVKQEYSGKDPQWKGKKVYYLYTRLAQNWMQKVR